MSVLFRNYVLACFSAAMNKLKFFKNYIYTLNPSIKTVTFQYNYAISIYIGYLLEYNLLLNSQVM